MIAAAFAPEPVIVRMSDFKSNEYASLLGGERYEPHEENPMIGYRGAARYLSPDFAECFAMECEALQLRPRRDGPDQRQDHDPVRAHRRRRPRASSTCSAQNGLRRGENDLQVVMMCEIPSNAVNADEFLDHFDGFSIGSNDMTQLTLGPRPRLGPGRRRLRRARPRRQEDAHHGHRGLPGRGQVRRHLRAGPVATTPTSPSGCSTRASSRCRSTPTPSSRPGCGWPGARPPSRADGLSGAARLGVPRSGDSGMNARPDRVATTACAPSCTKGRLLRAPTTGWRRQLTGS